MKLLYRSASRLIIKNQMAAPLARLFNKANQDKTL